MATVVSATDAGRRTVVRKTDVGEIGEGLSR